MKRIILILYILLSLPAIGQKEANIWYFGTNAGLDFNFSPPKILTDGKLNTVEGCASIADSDGNLLFYSDGVTVWNKNHSIMKNGTNLYGNLSSTQSAVIVPNPAAKNLYYLFTVDAQNGWKGFRYSVVDIDGDNGAGEITIKNSILASNVTEKVTAVKHADGRSIWVLIHSWNSSAFHAFLIDADSLHTNSVLSIIGTSHDGDDMNATGYMKASPKGDKIALAIYYSHTIEIFDFDNKTGYVANPLTIDDIKYDKPYGLEFSPNGSKLYVSCLNEPSPLYQFDLKAGSQKQIIESAKNIAPYNGSYYFSALQIAPDGIIYIAKYNSSNMAVLEFPNEAASMIRLNDFAIDLGKGKSMMGLPTFIQTYFKDDSVYIQASSPACEGDTIYIRASRISGAVYDWTGPGAFSGNSWEAIIPDADASNSGIYSCLIKLKNGKEYLITYILTVNPKPVFKLNYKDTVKICQGMEATLFSTSGDTSLIYRWSNGNTGKSIIVKDEGLYTLLASNPSGCSDSESVYVKVLPSSEFEFIRSPDKPLCEGDSILLSTNLQNDKYKFRWSTGDSSAAIPVTKSGVYSLTVTNEFGCESNKLIELKFALNPDVRILPEGLLRICSGDSIVLKASGTYAEYLWSTGETTPEITVRSPAVYTLEVTDINACKAFASAEVIVNKLNLASFPSFIDFGDICYGEHRDFEIKIENLDLSAITIDSVGLSLLSPDYSFTLDKTLPAELNQDEQCIATLRFMPLSKQISLDTLCIYISKPCFRQFKIPFSGSASSTLSVWIPDTVLDHNGDKIALPVFASYTSSSGEGKFNFGVEVSFDYTCFFPDNEGLSDNKILNDVRIIKMLTGDVILNSSAKLIGQIKGIPLISQLSRNRFTFKITDSQDTFKCLNLKDAIIDIKPVCIGNKSVIKLIDATLVNLMPNPADDRVELSLKQASNERYEVTLINTLGSQISLKNANGSLAEIKAIELSSSNSYRTEIYTSDFPSGVYLLRISGETELFTYLINIIH